MSLRFRQHKTVANGGIKSLSVRRIKIHQYDSSKPGSPSKMGTRCPPRCTNLTTDTTDEAPSAVQTAQQQQQDEVTLASGCSPATGVAFGSTEEPLPQGPGNGDLPLSLRLEMLTSIDSVSAEEWDAVASTSAPIAPKPTSSSHTGAAGSTSQQAAGSSHQEQQQQQHSASATSNGRPEPHAAAAEYEVNPFVLHGFLSALEGSGSARPATGWGPRHLLVRDQEGRLLGCCPLYIKGHSAGEYVFDQSWAEVSYRMGKPYYPKLQVSVPFTPCSGPRLMVRGGLSREVRRAVLRIMGRGLIIIAESSGMSSVHITFNTAEEWAALAELGYLQRTGIQFHWDNRAYPDFEDFLGDLKQSKRKTIRQERRSISKQGLRVRRLTGSEITPKIWDTFHGFYLDTIDRYANNAYLTRDFFTRLGETMGDKVMMVVAEATSDAVHDDTYRGSTSSYSSSSTDSLDMAVGGPEEGDIVAAALNLVGSHTIYGRNWGCSREYRNLHFELCYYQALDHAIESGMPKVEAGAQGIHKLQRGYMPSLTYSSHYILDPQLRSIISSFLDRERRQMQQQLQALSLEGSPFKDDTTLELLMQRLRAHFEAVNSSSSSSMDAEVPTQAAS